MPNQDMTPKPSQASPPRSTTGRARATGWHPPEVRTRALELLASGRSAPEVAKAFGVDRKTIWRWARAEGLPKQLEEDRGAAIERGRRRLVASIDRAVRTIVELVDARIVDRGEASGARVRLAAAAAVLDRVGLHARQELEVGGNALTDLFDKYGREPAERSA